jgi:hypothetical protein
MAGGAGARPAAFARDAGNAVIERAAHDVLADRHVYLVLGPWARPGIASTSGTLPFPASVWLPTLSVRALVIPSEVILGLLAVVGHGSGVKDNSEADSAH